MTDTLRLVDWDLATATATRFAPRGPSVTRPEAFDAVRQLRLLAVEAEDHVAAFTGLSAPHPHEPAFVADRSAWIEGNVGGFQVVMQPLLDKMAAKQAGKVGAPVVSALGSRVTGMQVGLLLAYLSGKVLGQYELFLPPKDGQARDGRLTLVAPNIVAAERQLGVDPRDFRLWVCVHEVTHQTQFTAVRWLRAHLHDEISAFLLASDLDPSAMLARLRDVGEAVRDNMRRRGSVPPDEEVEGLSFLEAVQNPEQRAILNRLTAVMTLLEGHGEYVMNGVGPAVIPTVEEIGAKFAERRRGQGPADRIVRKLFGLDMKARQYADGAAFVRAVVERAGMPAFNRVWTSPNTLPTKAEIAKPELWMSRVLRATVGDTPVGDAGQGGPGDGSD
ncbi:MAG TPA: zinc-dependent metalloprotease [Acidothermaceae bacterium]|jgi:coenzyme F420 biosynthesis associated uncharacterized protein